MNKLILSSLSIFVIGAFSYTNSVQVNASEKGEVESIIPLSDDSSLSNLNNEIYSNDSRTTLLYDSFSTWNSSIFSPWLGVPVMGDNLLTLPRGAAVSSVQLNFSGSTTYNITLGNLNGSLNLVIWDYANGLILTERELVGNGTNVSVNYTHPNQWPATGPVIMALVGEGLSTSTTFLQIELN